MDTRTKILVAAKRLFAASGVKHATLRMVTREAGVNIAAVNYHFGSKEDLVHAVFDDLARRLSERRLQMLSERQAAGAGKPIPVHEIVRIFLEPYMVHDGGLDGALLMNMIVQHRVEPTRRMQAIIKKYFDEIAERFVEAFAHSLPGKDIGTLYWRYYFMVSVIMYTGSASTPHRMTRVSGGLTDFKDRAALARELTDFISGGITAPENNKKQSKAASRKSGKRPRNGNGSSSRRGNGDVALH